MKKVILTVLSLILMLFLAGCQGGTGTNLITGNAVKNMPSSGLNIQASEGVQACGTYSESFKKICECLGDLERGDDGNYYCEGTCGYDCTCFRDKRVVPCPTE